MKAPPNDEAVDREFYSRRTFEDFNKLINIFYCAVYKIITETCFCIAFSKR